MDNCSATVQKRIRTAAAHQTLFNIINKLQQTYCQRCAKPLQYKQTRAIRHTGMIKCINHASSCVLYTPVINYEHIRSWILRLIYSILFFPQLKRILIGIHTSAIHDMPLNIFLLHMLCIHSRRRCFKSKRLRQKLVQLVAQCDGLIDCTGFGEKRHGNTLSARRCHCTQLYI